MKMHLRGIIGFVGPFLNPSKSLFARIEYVTNSAARILDSLAVNLDVRQVLRSIIDLYSLSAEHMLGHALVRRIGHVFRQRSTDLRRFYDFDWNHFLQAKRVVNGRGALSSASLHLSRALRSLGIDYEGAGSGGIGTRVNIGAPCRLWYPWFVAIRDQEGLGWFFSKCDTRLIEERVQILLILFARDRSAWQLALPFTQVLSELVDDVAAITQ